MDATINTFIISLNRLGDTFTTHAASMFLQSGLLIVILLIVDLLLRKRVKAVWRYCLWMLVFVKLVLPPSLSSPTSIAWWLADYKPTIASIPHQPAGDLPDLNTASE